MIINIIETKPGTELDRELSILTRDTHTPSGRLIHSAVNITCTTSVEFGDTYKIEPRRSSAERATAAYKELVNRSPALLDALMLSAEKQSPFLEVQVHPKSSGEPKPLSGNERLVFMALLIAWLANGKG